MASKLELLKELFDNYELEIAKRNGVYVWGIRLQVGDGFIDGASDTLEQAIWDAYAVVKLGKRNT